MLETRRGDEYNTEVNMVDVGRSQMLALRTLSGGGTTVKLRIRQVFQRGAWLASTPCRQLIHDRWDTQSS